MSQGALDRSRFEAIEAYVLGTMTDDERTRFDQDLAGDADLRQEMELQRENILAVELGGVTRMMKSISAEQGREERASGSWKQYLKYAAVVTIILSVSLWLLSRPSTNERLFAEHFTADPGLPVQMGASTDPAFSDAMVAYKLGDYVEARAKWAPLLQQEPMNDTLRFYIASAALASGDADAAIPLFKELGEQPTSAFQGRSRWYLFLAYVRTGKAEDAKAMKLEDDGTYGERVRAITSKLN